MTGHDLIKGIIDGTIQHIGMSPGCGGKSQSEPWLPPFTPEKPEGQHRIETGKLFIDTVPNSVLLVTTGCPAQDPHQIEDALLAVGVDPERVFIDDLSRDTFETFVILAAVLSQLDLKQTALPLLHFLSATYHYRVAKIIAQGLGYDLKHFYPLYKDKASSWIYAIYPWYAKYWDSLGEGWYPQHTRRRRSPLKIEEFTRRCHQLFSFTDCSSNHLVADAFTSYQHGDFFAHHFN